MAGGSGRQPTPLDEPPLTGTPPPPKYRESRSESTPLEASIFRRPRPKRFSLWVSVAAVKGVFAESLPAPYAGSKPVRYTEDDIPTRTNEEALAMADSGAKRPFARELGGPFEAEHRLLGAREEGREGHRPIPQGHHPQPHPTDRTARPQPQARGAPIRAIGHVPSKRIKKDAHQLPLGPLLPQASPAEAATRVCMSADPSAV